MRQSHQCLRLNFSITCKFLYGLVADIFCCRLPLVVNLFSFVHHVSSSSSSSFLFDGEYTRRTWIKPIPEYQTILDLMTHEMLEIAVVQFGTLKICKAPVRSLPPEYQHEFFTGQMPFLVLNQQCQSIEWQRLTSSVKKNSQNILVIVLRFH